MSPRRATRIALVAVATLGRAAVRAAVAAPYRTVAAMPHVAARWRDGGRVAGRAGCPARPSAPAATR